MDITSMSWLLKWPEDWVIFPEAFEDLLKIFSTDEFMAHNINIHEWLIVGKSGVFRNKFKFKKVTFRMFERDLIVPNKSKILALLFYTDGGCIGPNKKYAVNVQWEKHYKPFSKCINKVQDHKSIIRYKAFSSRLLLNELLLQLYPKEGVRFNVNNRQKVYIRTIG